MPDDLPVILGYTVFGEIGRGGMGVIYRAHQISLDRPVALKVLRKDANVDDRERFRSEAEAAARLRHPHIAQVYDAGTFDGRPYFAMEFLDGGTLARKLSAQPQLPIDAATLVEALARAAQHAHENGVVHRDLKPANVLLAADGSAKIADFGLARQTVSGLGTRTGDLLGTPSYMAPEQAAGRSHQSGPAGDIYSLGAVLYECLTGRPPFQGDSLVETLEQVQGQPVTAPRRIVSHLPADLEAICLKCLEKEPGMRYVTAGLLAEDLRQFLDRRPVLARPVGVIGRLEHWCRRNRTAAGVIVVLLLYSAIATCTIWWRSR
jgi:eukaryotic-like serine/threonine-protein kinase